MLYNLQNIIIPDKTVCDEPNLYYRNESGVILAEGELLFAKNAECVFSTYFNAFSLNKWKEYTRIKNLFICLSFKGVFLVEIYSSKWLLRENIVHDCLYSKVLDSQDEKVVLPVDISKNDAVYFKLTALSDDAVFYGGSYASDVDEADFNPVEIDLVMCTFKREPFVKRNLRLLTDTFFADPKYNGAAHFNVRIVDNGQTLDARDIATSDGKVKLYPNINTGGSGGFSRGMIESLHEGNATHILFMDDDVLVQVEAFERTYNLLHLLKDEYKDAFLGGAMFRLDNKKIQLENTAAYKGTSQGLSSLKFSRDMTYEIDVLFNEIRENVAGQYQGWWYCCIPVGIARLNNLPYPFFIRMDDMEYSIRNTKKFITLNGINVWHEAFDRKYSALMENYFMFRNSLVVNMLHNISSRSGNIIFFFRRFVRELIRYDYRGAEFLLDGVENFLKGPSFYRNVDTEGDLKVHALKQTKTIPISAIDNYDTLFDVVYDATHNHFKESLLQRIIRLLSFNGYFLPNCFFNDWGYAEYGYTSSSKLYYRHKRVLAVDLNYENAIIVEMDRKKAFALIMRFLKLAKGLFVKYHILESEYKESFSEMISEVFWRRYLKMS